MCPSFQADASLPRGSKPPKPKLAGSVTYPLIERLMLCALSDGALRRLVTMRMEAEAQTNQDDGDTDQPLDHNNSPSQTSHVSTRRRSGVPLMSESSLRMQWLGHEVEDSHVPACGLAAV